MLPLLVILGCAPCPSASEIAVLGDTEGVATLALNDFVAWTGDAPVCANTIEVVEVVTSVNDPARDAVGQYQAGKRIIIVEGADDFLYDNVLHELGHAYDQHGRPSRDAEDLLAYDSEKGDYASRSEASRVREAFAVTVESSPFTLDLVAELADCDADTSAAAWVRDEVFGNAPFTVPADSQVALEDAGSVALPGSWAVAEPIQAGLTVDGQVFLQLTSGDYGVVDVTTGDSTEVGLPTVSAVTTKREGQVPSTWEPASGTSFSSGDDLFASTIRLANGDGIAILLADEGESLSLPQLRCMPPGAVVFGDGATAWWVGVADGELLWARYNA
jgi:hypothetical protein